MTQWLADNWLALSAIVIAVYGAVLSTVIYWLHSHRLEVTLHEEMPWGGREHNLVLTVKNPGPNPMVRVVSALLGLPMGLCIGWPPDTEGKVLIFKNINVDLPHDLERGENFVAMMNVAEVVRDLRQQGLKDKIRLQSEVWDAQDRSYHSNKIKLDLDESLPMVESDD